MKKKKRKIFNFNQDGRYVFDFSGTVGDVILPTDVKNALNEAGGNPITVNFASPGGYVYDGIEIFNLIREYKGKKKAVITSQAMSISSYIAMAFDEIEVYDNSVFMIHNPFMLAMGDHKEFRKTADFLEALTDILSKAYANKTGKNKDDILSLMDEETYFYGEGIQENGFADTIISTDEDNDKNATIAIARAKVKDLFMSLDEKKQRKQLEKVAALVKPKNLPAAQKMNGKAVAHAKKLIASNDVNRASEWEFTAADGNKILGPDKDWSTYGKFHLVEDTSATENTKGRYKYPVGKEGVVYRSALVAIQEKATKNNFSELLDVTETLISEIDKGDASNNNKNKTGVRAVDKKELLARLQTLREGGQLSNKEIENAFCVAILTDEQKEALNEVSQVKKAYNVDSLSDSFKEMNETIQENEGKVIEAKITEAFGPKAGKDGTPNLIRDYAERQLKNATLETVEKEIDNLKEDPIMKKLAADSIDYRKTVAKKNKGASNNKEFGGPIEL